MTHLYVSHDFVLLALSKDHMPNTTPTASSPEPRSDDTILSSAGRQDPRSEETTVSSLGLSAADQAFKPEDGESTDLRLVD